MRARTAATWGAASVVVLGAAGIASWRIVPRLLVDDFADWPVDASGWEIERVDGRFAATFCRGSEVWISMSRGELFVADDDDLSRPWEEIPCPLELGARNLFVSSRGVVFAGVDGGSLHRSGDRGASWKVCLDVPTWRQTEDDLGHLYVGNYDDSVARVLKSEDEGVTWRIVFRYERCQHVHTVRWDERAGDLWVAFGDGRHRGQAVSPDRGETWTIVDQGRDQGHTDVAFTPRYRIWASDDQSGRVYRVARDSGRSETLMGWSQFMWWTIADGENLLVGTMASSKNGGERAAVLASSDEGTTWRKILATEPSRRAYDRGWIAESRSPSANGWIYCYDGRQGWRVRRGRE